MALLPSEPHKQYALLGGIAAIALSYFFFTMWYEPRREDVERLESSLTVLQDRNRTAQIIAAREGPELEERLAVYERHLQRMEELIPTDSEVPALLNTITSEANRFGVEMGSLRPETLLSETYYTRESYQVSVFGDFHRIGQFLTSIASLPRIITPVDLQVTPFTGSIPPRGVEDPVIASFRIQTYTAPTGRAPSSSNDLSQDMDR